MKLTSNFYLTADTHFFHNALLHLTSRPENFDEMIVENWNKVVTKREKVLHLGDLSLGNKEKTMAISKRLRGEKYLIRGNHDGKGQTWFRECGFEVVEKIYKVFTNEYDQRIPVLFTHAPVLDLPRGWFNIHGHLHSNKPISDDSNHRGIILNNQYYDVGVDAHNFKLVKLY